MKRKNGMFTLAKDRPLMHVKWNQVIWTFVKKNRIHSTKKFLFWNYILCFENEVKVFSISFFQRGHLYIEEALLQKHLSKMDSQHCTSVGGMPQVEIPDEKDQRFCVLSYEQVKRLNDLMSDVISIHGRGNFPTIDVKLCDLVSVVRRKLEEDGVNVKEIRLNGSGASTVLVWLKKNIIPCVPRILAFIVKNSDTKILFMWVIGWKNSSVEEIFKNLRTFFVKLWQGLVI